MYISNVDTAADTSLANAPTHEQTNHPAGYCELCDPPGYVGHQHTATCTEQTFPAPAYEYGPSGAPLRGRVGLSVHGVNIYGPEEAGFGIGGLGYQYHTRTHPTHKANTDATTD